MSKVGEHDFDGQGFCRKCHTHRSKLTLRICPVIGADEVASWRLGEDES